MWCNALTEYYNANNGSGTDLAVVYCSDAAYTTPIRTSTNSDTITATTAGSQDDPYVNALAKGFRLPTSMEYEFAARYIGTTAPKQTNVVQKDGVYYTNGSSASGATAAYTNRVATSLVAIFDRNYTDASTYTEVTGTAVVKSKHANALGLFDMSGNVSKWTFNWYKGETYYRVLRGGAFSDDASDTWAGDVDLSNPLNASYPVGFRFARSY